MKRSTRKYEKSTRMYNYNSLLAMMLHRKVHVLYAKNLPVAMALTKWLVPKVSLLRGSTVVYLLELYIVCDPGKSDLICAISDLHANK